jgi:subtilase family serine protease
VGVVTSATAGAARHPRGHRLVAVALAGICVAAAAAIGVANAARSEITTPASAVRTLGPMAAGARIAFELELVLPGQARLQRDLAAIADPRSPLYHHYIGAREFGQRYGISAARLRRLERALAAAGVRVTRSYPQRTEIAVSATVSTVERLLGARILRYAGAGGERWHAPRAAPVIPSALRASVSAVTGLSTRPVWQPQDVPYGGLTAHAAAIAYDYAPLAAQGVDGQGETIAIVSLTQFDTANPATFAAQQGIAGAAATIVRVDGGANDSQGADETNLDVEVMRSVAPAARVIVYEAPDNSDTGFADIVNTVVAQHSATIISTSWGQCLPGLDSAQHSADTAAVDAAVRAGISIVAASGDQGAYDCQGESLSDHQLSVDWPAANPDVIGAGGTRLYLDRNDTYNHEAAWEGALSESGGGGGLAAGIPKPSWQVGPGVENRYSTGVRQVPDVSADADPGTGWMVFTSGPANSSGDYPAGQYVQIGGTSAAAPFWSATLALVEEYVRLHGGAPVGFAAPMLYALAAHKQAFPPFHDVTFGGNRFYQATPGWDYATGLGSPDDYNLARDALAYLKR